MWILDPTHVLHCYTYCIRKSTFFFTWHSQRCQFTLFLPFLLSSYFFIIFNILNSILKLFRLKWNWNLCRSGFGKMMRIRPDPDPHHCCCSMIRKSLCTLLYNKTRMQITMNDLPVGRSVDETLRLVQAFQYTDKHGEVTTKQCSGSGSTCFLASRIH